MVRLLPAHNLETPRGRPAWVSDLVSGVTMGKGNIEEPDPPVEGDMILLETGDVVLLETGDRLLREVA